jgi:lysozyme
VGMLPMVKPVNNQRAAGATLCTKWEGLHTVKADGLVYAYICPAGYPTQGYGIVVESMNVPAITVEEAERKFDLFFAKYEQAAANLCKVPYTENQLGALACFCFNVGIGALKSSTLLRKFNRGDSLEEVAAEFLKWNKSNGKILKGLTKRRKEEAELFLNNDNF